jgi:hypothetical protein
MWTPQNDTTKKPRTIRQAQREIDRQILAHYRYLQRQAQKAIDELPSAHWLRELQPKRHRQTRDGVFMPK